MKSYKNVLLKLSGEALKNNTENTYDVDYIKKLSKNISRLLKEEPNIKIVLILGGGNIWRGVYSDQIENSSSDYMGMLATIMNGIFVENIFKKMGILVQHLCAFEIKNICKQYNPKEAQNILKTFSDVIIISGGTGKPYCTTDSAAALRATELNCKKILFGKNNVDGIYNKDPNKYQNAKKIKIMDYDYYIECDLKIIDKKAVLMCKKEKIECIVFDINNAENIVNIFNDNQKYSIIK